MTLHVPSGRCGEFEARIVDALVDGVDAETREHLRRCAACARLAAEYLGAAEFAKRALPSLPFAPAPLFPRTITLAGIAAALALAVTAFWLGRTGDAELGARPLTVLPQANAVIEKVDAYRARIREGESTFVLTDPDSAVETPFGSLRCPSNCEFTVRIERDDCGWILPATLDPAGQLNALPVRVAIDVASGEVVSHQNGRADILAAAHRLNLPFDHYR